MAATSTQLSPVSPLRVLLRQLDGATEETVTMMLAPLPEPVRAAFESDWRLAYNTLTRWPTS